MKKAIVLFALALFLTQAYAISADSFTVRASPAGNKINAWVFLKGDYPAINVKVDFSNVPDGVELKEDSMKRIPYLPAKGMVQLTWNAVLSKDSYDFTDSFTILSWDDEVSLDAFFVVDDVTTNETIESETDEVMIFGKSDGTALCQQMKSIPGEENNTIWMMEKICNAQITVNGGDPIAVNDTGHFFTTAKLTKQGMNMLNVTATDASGNTKTVTLKAVFNGVPDTPSYQSMDLLLTVGVFAVFLVLFIAAVFLFLKFGKNLIKKSPAKPATEKPAEKKPEKEPEPQEKPKEKPKEKSFVWEEKKTPKKAKGKLAGLKAQRDDLNQEITSLKAKKKLSAKEKEEGKKATEELDKIEEQLLKDDEFLLELEERAFKALMDAREGKNSKQIKKELLDEGYTDKEIKKIREFFIKGKT